MTKRSIVLTAMVAVVLSIMTPTRRATAAAFVPIGEADVVQRTEGAPQYNEALVKSEAEMSRIEWETTTTPKLVTIQATAATKRYTILYAGEMPKLTIINTAGVVFTADAPPPEFVIRPDNKLEGFEELRYATMYVTDAKAAEWKVTLTGNAETKFLYMIQSEGYKNWETEPERMTYLYEIVTWHNEKDYTYQASSLRELAKASTVIERPKEETKEEKPALKVTDFLPLIFLFALPLIGFIIFRKRSKASARNDSQSKRRQAIAAEIKERKAKENETLIQYMSQYDDEYTDADYINEVRKEPTREKEPVPAPERVVTPPPAPDNPVQEEDDSSEVINYF